MFPLAAMPRPPCKPAARSVMMSPNMLLVTITSNWRGSRTICMQSASTYMCCAVICGYSPLTSLNVALPQASGVGHGIRLVAHQDFVARRAIEFGVLFAVLEGVADDSLDSLARVDVLLRRDLVGRSLLEDAARVGVNALGVLADHDEVHVLGPDAFQRAERGIQQPHRSHVGVEVHLEAHAEQDFLGMDVRLDPGIAEGADKNRVEVAAQHGEAIGWHRGLVAQVAVGAPVEVAEFHGGPRGLDGLDCLRNHFLADTVSGDDGDTLSAFLFRVHGRKVNTIAIIELAMGQTALQVYGEGLGAESVGEYRGAVTAARFGDPQAEFATLRNSCGVYDLGFRAKISLAGSDRVRWLNGMVTNNIRDLAIDQGVYAFLLNPQGHILGDLYAYNRGEAITVDTDCSQVEKILATFDHYIIMDDVEVANHSEQLTALGIAGPKSRAVLASAGFEIPEMRGLQVLSTKWHGADCALVKGQDEEHASYEIWLGPADVRRLWDALLEGGAAPVGFEAMELHRIVSGVPRYGVDIRERDLPQETEQTRALNFNKGCYVGQEIVERIRSRGAVHRKFAGFLADSAAPIAVAAKIIAGEKEVGEITSVASLRFAGGEKTVALGYIRREVGVPGREVTIGAASAAVVQLPIADAVLLQERSLEHHRA